MRGLTWFLGVMIALLGVQLGRLTPGAWTVAWVIAAVLWFFVGCGLGASALYRLAVTKRVPGVASSFRGGQETHPRPAKDE
jgi:hypothetical protein